MRHDSCCASSGITAWGARSDRLKRRRAWLRGSWPYVRIGRVGALVLLVFVVFVRGVGPLLFVGLGLDEGRVGGG